MWHNELSHFLKCPQFHTLSPGLRPDCSISGQFPANNVPGKAAEDVQVQSVTFCQLLRFGEGKEIVHFAFQDLSRQKEPGLPTFGNWRPGMKRVGLGGPLQQKLLQWEEHGVKPEQEPVSS